MKVISSLRILLLALAATLIPASSFGGVFISVNFAPPLLPVYEQPPCPDEGMIWIPGYWAYDEDGYYWVPGTWVPAPYEGALWTPPYWGWENNFYVFHPGYWGDHVGYYGGVNYGYGYMGVGFVGGMWRGHSFVYNTAVMRVDERRIRNVYVDRDVVRRYTIANDRRVSFSGGRDGIHHDPMPQERFADRDRHVEESQYQRSHENAARSDKSFYARNNGGHPSNVVVQRPMNGPNSMPDNRGGFQRRDNGNQSQGPQYQDRPGYRGGYNDPRSNTREYDNRNTYNPPPNVNNQNRDNAPRQDNSPGGQYRNPPQQQDPRSNARGYDNRNTYTPPPNAGNQNRNNNQQPGYGQQPGRDQQPGDRNPRYRNDAPPQQNNPAPQFRPYNNPHGNQDNMQNRGGPPQQQQPQQPRQQPQYQPPQQQQPQPQQQRGDQGGGHGDHGDHGDRGHDRQR